MNEKEADVLVIGGGPGGYPAAIRASQLNKKVILVEKGFIGGECLNWGCIPSKSLISAADFYYRISHEAKEMGITAKQVTIDIEKLQKWKNKVIKKLVGGVKQLLKGNKVEVIMGTAELKSKNSAKITTEGGEKIVVKADSIILATGARFKSLPNIVIDEKNILSAKGILSLKEVPEHLVCIGGGVVSLELGTVYAKLGSKVTIIEIMPELFYNLDPDIVKVLRKKISKLDVEILTDSQATKVEQKGGKLLVTVFRDNRTSIIEADKILLSVGKEPNIEKLGLEQVGIETDSLGFIKTNSKQQTNVENIYAVGDCTGLPFLAHRATKQGIIAAEVIAGLASEADFRAMPGAIFTDPEIAFAGLTEKEAIAEGYTIVTAEAPFRASGRALTQLETEGFVKVIVNAENGVLLGAQIVGPHASELISEIALALEMGATAEDISFTVHPHPTLPEMIMEALEAAQGKAIHVANPKKR